MERHQKIIRTSGLSIAVNVILVLFKMAVGFLSGSIAIILDAVNNLSDALSSIINIIGTKLASRSPDKKHPYGHGRIEYITTIIISLLILFAGATSIKEAVETILNRDTATYSAVTIIIVVVGIGVKFFLGRYMIRIGDEVDAKALIVSGKECLFDSFVAIGTLLAALISIFFHISLEGFVGAAISILIIKAGGEMLAETLSVVIGLRSERELTGQLKSLVNSFPQVRGAYDVILHNYGPSQHIGSVHIEVSEDLTSREIHHLSQQIMMKVYDEMNIVLTVGIYSDVKSDPRANELRKAIGAILKDYPDIMQMHGFYLDENRVGFDLVIDFKEDSVKIRDEIIHRLEALYPTYQFFVLLDLDYSD